MQKALILIDYINDICNPQGKIPNCAPMIINEKITDKVNNLLSKVRADNWLVIWVVVGFDANYYAANTTSPIFSKAKKFRALELGTWGTALLAELDYNQNELIICKSAVNPFHATNLDHILRAQGITDIYLAGVSTEVAIQSCTRDGHDRGYSVNIISDCCASGNIDYHNASLAMLGNMANIITSDQLVSI